MADVVAASAVGGLGSAAVAPEADPATPAAMRAEELMKLSHRNGLSRNRVQFEAPVFQICLEDKGFRKWSDAVEIQHSRHPTLG